MATIALYANKINQMPGLVRDVKQSVIDYKTELSTLKNKTLSINSSVCNLDDVISSIQTSTQTQEEKIASLDTFIQDSEEFISEVVRIDEDVADIVRQRKDDFYEQYYYLKPECEKDWKEKAKDWLASAGEWCKEHWKAIATVVIVIAAVLLIYTGIGGILGAMALGALLGAGIGGLLGGIMSVFTGGSFWEGFENGAFSGAISGIITGGMGFALSAGGTIALSFGQTILIGGVSGAGSSLISDLGDIFFKGDNISFGEVMLNMSIAGTLGMLFAGVGYGISKGFSALKVKFGGKVTPLENGPYIKNGKPNGRPGPTGKAKLKFEQDVYNRCVGRDGILRDPNTGKVLDWKPGQPRKGIVDFGHKAGKGYNKLFQNYKNGKISLEQLKGFQCNPKNFRIEEFSANRGHMFEKTILEITKGFPWLSSAANVVKEYIYEN